MTIASLRDLYVEQLRDLYDGENQIIKALPKMIESTESEELRSALEEHLEITRQQAQRLETIFEGLGEDAKGEKCKGMEGIIKEGSEVVKEDMSDTVKDAAIIAAAQRVEHYEIAGYGTVRTYADLLGEEQAVELLQQTLDEEKEADEKLSQLAEEINVEAEGGEGEEGGSEMESEETAKPRRSAKSTAKKGKRVA
jgi:ferritin-like metal-binding protein YciE